MLKAIIFDMDGVIADYLPEEERYVPVSGIKELLEELHRSNIRLAAISSVCSSRELEQAIKSIGIYKYFHKLLSGIQEGTQTPSPDTFRAILKKMGINAREALAVEAAQDGIAAATEAGIAAIGYPNPRRPGQSLKQAAVVASALDGLDIRFFKNVLHRTQGEPVVIASTKRLLIRELSQEDIDDMYQIFQDPKIREFVDNIDDYKQAEKDKLNAYIRNVYSFYGYGLWGVFSKTTHGLIGRCGIENQMIDGREEIMLSYLLDSEHWGYGYAIECCHAVLQYARNELNIERIVAVIDKRNTRSIRTAQKLGMAEEKELLYKNRACILYVHQI